MLQGIGAAFIGFVLLPSLVWVLTRLLKLNCSATKFLALSLGAYLSVLIGAFLGSCVQNALSQADVGPVLAWSVGITAVIAVNGALARVICKSAWSTAVVYGVGTLALLAGASFAALILLLQGISFC